MSIRRQRSPKTKFSIGAQYEFNMGDWGTLTPRLDYTYRSSMQADAFNTPESELPSVGLFNGRISWSDVDQNWTISANVSNLGDKFYYESYFGRGQAPYFSGTGRPGWPREWYLTIRRNF
ncbi:MAG: TonB-dependent receptor [Gammaproteobacteria bacterium]|nr:TonB-dependent receptor [Gammaproteobacteria bacterium]